MTPLERVTRNGYIIQWLTPAERTAEVCLAAVTRNGYIIQWLTPAERTAEVCLAAVTRNGYPIQYLTPEQRTAPVCLAAVTSNGYAIHYLTAEECLLSGLVVLAEETFLAPDGIYCCGERVMCREAVLDHWEIVNDDDAPE